MKIIVISDIHSNKYALQSVLNYIDNISFDKMFLLGDYFGYYPWAEESYNLLEPYLEKSVSILGNHDDLIISDITPEKKPEYWDVIQQNKNELSLKAKQWLRGLNTFEIFEIDDKKYKLFHGTPDDSLNGRYYPDNERNYSWFPKINEVLILGHTHYPMIRYFDKNSLLLNPGSVGQSRDWNTKASFAILDSDTLKVEIVRVEYDINKAISELQEMKWYFRAINALFKINKII
jgi:putative phosphoesterase